MGTNTASICTYYVSNEQEISQPGYICEIVREPAQSNANTTNNSNSTSQANQAPEKIEKVYICSSCAQNIKGKFRITKFTKRHTFSCYVGRCKLQFFYKNIFIRSIEFKI